MAGVGKLLGERVFGSCRDHVPDSHCPLCPALPWPDTPRTLRVASDAAGWVSSLRSSSDDDESSKVSSLLLAASSCAVGAPRVFHSCRAVIECGVGGSLMDISPSDVPSISREAPMQRKLRIITSLFSRQNRSFPKRCTNAPVPRYWQSGVRKLARGSS